MRLKTLLLAGLASLASASPAAAQYLEESHDHAHGQQQAQPTPPARPAAPIAPPPAQLADTTWQTELGFEPEVFRAHVAFLADDMLEGRDAGSRGHELAAHYVATQMQALGVTPGNNGSWYQRVPFTRSKGSSGRLTVGGRSFTVGQDLVFLPGIAEQPLAMDAQAVFGGQGVIDAASGRDDLAGLDLAGKILVIMAAQGVNPQAGIMAAASRGAIGAVVIRPAEAAATAPLSRAAGGVGATRLVEEPAAAGAAGPMGALRFIAMADMPVLEAMFANAPRPLAQVAADLQAKRPVRGFAFAPAMRLERTVEPDRFTSPNVVAIIPGSDPALRNEYVLLSAHLDHVGIRGEATGQRNIAGAEDDRIFNGAMDNATGIATLLEVARKFMEPGNRPKRSILIAAVTAEEDGLLGSKYLARNPVVPGKIVANVNLDMPILTYAFKDVVAFGAEHSSLGPIVERAAKTMNVALIPDPLPQERLFTRSDHYSFVQAGIPAVFLMTGFGGEGEQRFKSFLANEYHSPKDDMNLPIDWKTGARFAELNYRIAREIANAAQAPRWYQGSEFAPKDAQTVPAPKK
ncbi:MAG TPA: M20/M25/M40 family metallo-hydrolase [Allosphingosinicella sp.]|nr:M20/M25/M40 family metallo-hydrolase [Allosphingosinicella sp.]